MFLVKLAQLDKVLQLPLINTIFVLFSRLKTLLYNSLFLTILVILTYILTF